MEVNANGTRVIKSKREQTLKILKHLKIVKKYLINWGNFCWPKKLSL